MRAHPGRGGAAWARVRKQVLADAQVCHICGGELDFTADPRSTWAPTVDHVIPLAKMRDYDADTQRQMALDPTLLRPAHYGCNSRRGAGRVAQPRRSSRSW